MEYRLVIPTLEGVTVAIVAFLLVCLAWPHLVKSKTHWYVAFMCAIGIILLQTGTTMLAGSGITLVFGVLIGVFQVVGLVMLVLAVGGLTPRELRSDVMKTIEVIRRGDEKKEVIVPMSGERPTPSVPRAAPVEEDRVVYSIDPDAADAADQRIPVKPNPPVDKPGDPIPLD